ncbi:MAG TPA: SpoIID/LytB domain-containing protein, partial [Candidatus Eisenbacteria bacterium]|nr:SpoIID/LytB domain-containing protein [Candidatus Eisenbacteria bacterium]
MHLLTRLVLAAAVATAGLVTTPLAAGAATCPAPGGVSVPEASGAGDVVFRGHGWGHGLGLSQYGAQGAASLGCTYGQILTTYYRGASVTSATMPSTVYLRMLAKGVRADVTAEDGAVTWQLVDSTGVHGVASQPQGATWRLERDPTNTKFRLYDLTNNKEAWVGGAVDQSLRLYHSGTVVHLVTSTWDSATSAYKTYLDRRLRWDYTRFDYDGSLLDAVQVIQDNTFGTGMQKYLWGIAEMPTLFPTEALKAQVVAARTYAARRGGGSVTAPLMPTPADQNYTGYAKESEDAQYGYRWKGAVDATDGQVLKDSSGSYLIPYYSSSMGGYTEDVRYVGWSSTAVGYLSAVDDSRWEMASSNKTNYRSWAVGFSWTDLASRLGFSSVSSISVAPRGTAARLAGVKVVGTRGGVFGTYYLTGWDVRQRLGLLSPGFTVDVTAVGGPGAQPIVGDWNGDGHDDLGWYKDGNVALDMGGANVLRFRYGSAGDVAVVGDWNGDGRDEIGIVRGNVWYLRKSLTS